jgi:hypothetical protein
VVKGWLRVESGVVEVEDEGVLALQAVELLKVRVGQEELESFLMKDEEGQKRVTELKRTELDSELERYMAAQAGVIHFQNFVILAQSGWYYYHNKLQRDFLSQRRLERCSHALLFVLPLVCSVTIVHYVAVGHAFL